METFVTAIAHRFGLKQLEPGSKSALVALVNDRVTTWHPTSTDLHELTEGILYLCPLVPVTTLSVLIETTLYEPVYEAVETVVRTHWTAMAKEGGIQEPWNAFDMCIYHAFCPDGTAAAWAFWRRNPTIELVHLKHGQPPPNVKGRRVVVVDFSFKRPIIEQLRAEAVDFRVLDHHASAEKDLVGLPYCTFDMTKAGAQLAWDFVEGDAPYPWFITAISDRDLWKKVPESEAIGRALQKRKMVNMEGLNTLYVTPQLREKLIAEGNVLLAEDKEKIDAAVKYSRLYKMGEYIVRVASCDPALRSEVGNAMCLEGDCDFSATWTYVLENDEWWVSLRGVDKVDLSVLTASIANGGGHKNAAGFTIYGQRGENLRTYFTPITN